MLEMITKMVLEKLKTATPQQRKKIFDAVVKDYCIACGERKFTEEQRVSCFYCGRVY